MGSNADDWKEKMREASTAAQKHADELTDDQLEAIAGQVKKLNEILTNLQLADEATYQKLVGIVDEATRRNQSIGEIVERIRALGDAFEDVVTVVEGLTPAKALSTLRESLNR